MEVIKADLYDYPKYYDLVFGSDWKAEFEFLEACFDRYAKRDVWRLFEPACGTGRLLIKFAERGYDAAGNDLNAKAIDYCNRALKRRGLAPSAVVGDMTDFRLSRKVDAAFNMINSFRHLPSEEAALGHLRSTAAALAKGGLYILGMHLTPESGEPGEAESWSARRGHLTVISRLWTVDVDLARRTERVGMTFDVYTPTRRFRLENEMGFRTYTAIQFHRLLRNVPELESVGTYDFAYDLSAPLEVDGRTEDVVYVLRKR